MNEKQLNENFAIIYNDHPQKVYGIKLSNLMDPLEIKEFVIIYSEKLKALTPQVAATYFCKYYGWALAGFHYFHSLNYNVNMSPSNIEIQLYYDEGHDYYGLVFKLVDPILQPGKKEGIDERIRYLYKENVTPLLEAFVIETGLKIRELWGQLCIGLYFGYDFNLKESITDVQRQNVIQDFDYLTKTLDSEIFKTKKNPLDITFKMIPNARNPEVYQRMKPTCCLYYQTEDATNKCYGCPRMSDAEREVRRQEIIADAN